MRSLVVAGAVAQGFVFGGLVALILGGGGRLAVIEALFLGGSLALALALWQRPATYLAVRRLRARPFRGPAALPIEASLAWLAKAMEVPQPSLMIVPGHRLDIGALAGRPPAIVVTEAILELTPLEVEAVLAHELLALAQPDLKWANQAGLAAWFVRPPRRARSGEVSLDYATVKVTRYPPALAASLERLAGQPYVDDSGQWYAGWWPGWILVRAGGRELLELRVALLEEF